MRRLAPSLLLLVVPALTACPREATIAAPDAAPARGALRVVSLAPSSTEILYAIGAGDRLIGVDRYSDYPAAAAALPRVGTNIDPSIERIVSLHPDLVLTASTANVRPTAEALERLGVRVFTSDTPRDLDGIYADIRAIASRVDASAGAERLIASMRERVARSRARCARDGAAPTRALVVVWSAPLVVAGKASHIADLLAAACAVNVAADTSQAFPSYSLERVVAGAPEVIIVGTHGGGEPPPLETLQRLTTVPAVRDHRLLLVDGDLLFRPGPRVVDAIDLLAARIRP